MQNLFDKASLVMVPSGYDNGKLYNIKPEDKGSAFEFERATMATRVNSSGLVETMFPEATNLLTYSNEFTNSAWNSFTNGLTRTASNITDPDGGNNAWEITTTATNEHHRLGHTMTSGQIKTISFYAKANGYEYVRVWAFSGGNTNSNYFHLSGEGATGGNGQLNIKSIESVGNGWYRCQCVLDPNNNGAVVISPAPDASTAQSTNTYLADGASGIYLYNAQLEAGYFATPYIETTTQTVTRQNQANQPRIDYTSGEGALLLEPARTNLYANSGDFTTWNRYNNIPYEVSNENVISGEKSVIFDWQDTNTFIRLLGQTFTGIHTTSMYIKPLTLTRLQFNYTVIDKGATFDFNSNSVVSNTGTAASIEDAGDGWYRLISTADLTGASNSQLRVSIPENIYAGTAHVSGFQQEAGSYATSYIPTNGQQETRAADLCINAGSADTFNDTEGVLYAEVEFDNEASYEQISVGSGTNSMFVSLGKSNNQGDNAFYIRAYDGTTFQGPNQVLSGYSSLDNNKIAFQYGASISDFKIYINGNQVSYNFSGTVPTLSGIDKLSFRQGSVGPTYGTSKMIAYFPETLTDEELQRLTSLSADATTFTELANNNGYTIL